MRYEPHLTSLVKVVVKKPKVDILEKIKITKDKDKEVIRIVEKMKEVNNTKILREDKWEIDDKLVLKKRKVYISKDEVLRLKVI